MGIKFQNDVEESKDSNINNVYESLQSQYLKNRNDYYLSKMYTISKLLSQNCIKLYCKNKSIYLQNIEELAHDSATYILEQYLWKPEFKIEKITSYIHFGCVKQLFKHKDIDMNEVSLETIVHI